MSSPPDVKITTRLKLDGSWRFEIQAPAPADPRERWFIQVSASRSGPQVTWAIRVGALWEGPAVTGVGDWVSAHAALEGLLRDAVAAPGGRRLEPLLTLLGRIREPWMPDIAAGPSEQLLPAPPAPAPLAPVPAARSTAPLRNPEDPCGIRGPLDDPDDHPF